MTESDATRRGISPADAAGTALELSVRSGSDSTARIPCRRVVTLIGSREGCKVQLKHSVVAPVHVAIVNDGSEVYAADMITRRGTLLNGLKMEHEALNDGDTLTVDPWDFGVHIRRPEHGGNGQVHKLDLEPEPQLIALEHLESGRVLQPNRKICVVGRRSGCDIRLDDARVSRAHAILFVHHSRPVVCDLLSRNGTFVNDEPVAFAVLKDQDVLTIGDAAFRVRVIDAIVGQRRSQDIELVTPPGTKAPNDATTVASTPLRKQAVELEDDLVDIQAVEGSQRWHIADKLEQSTGKR